MKERLAMTPEELSKFKGWVLWHLNRYLPHHDIEGSDAALRFYGWLSQRWEDLVDDRDAYQHVKTWLEEFKEERD